MARKPTKGELDWLRRRQESGGSLSQTSLNLLAENTPGAIVVGGSRVKNGPRRNQQAFGPGGRVIRTYGTLADAREAAEKERGTATTHPSGFEGSQGKPADTSGQQSGRKRTRLPTDSDGINETRYMREFREQNKNVGDAFGKIGGSLTEHGSFAFHSDGNGGLRSGLPHWNEGASRRAEADRRRRIMDSIEANRTEGLAAGARVLKNFDKFTSDMDQVALGKKNPVETVQTMKDIMRDAQTNVGMTDRKFSSGQGFSEKNRQKLDNFAGTLVDKAIDSISENIDWTYKHRESAEAKALGGAIAKAGDNATVGSLTNDMAVRGMQNGTMKGSKAAEVISGNLDQTIKSTKELTQATRAYNEKNKADRAANEQYFAEVQADIDKAKFAMGREASPRVGPVGPVDQNGRSQQENQLHQEMIQRQNELWKKKQQGQADWGGGISDRARRFIDRRRTETSGALARFLAGREVA